MGIESTLLHQTCRTGRLYLAAAGLALLLAVPAGAIETTFDTDLEGWTVNGDNDSRWQAGTLYVDDLATGDANYVIAPLAWLGDWSDVTAADTLGVDYHFVNTSGGPLTPPPWLFELKGPGGHARALPSAIPPTGQWTRLSVTMNPSDWTMASGTWQGLLAEVHVLVLGGEFVRGEEDVFVDNIRLTHSPAPIPFPCVTEKFNNSVLFDLRFDNTGGVTTPQVGGNLAGFCQITDAAGTSYAYAPPRFLGNWTPLEGTGTIGLDVRILSYTGTPVGATEFIRISGPGGTAHVPMAAADLPPSSLVWKRYAVPIQPAAWTMTAGTWAALINNVTECRITVEFINGTEVVGIDNLSRGGVACGDPDNPIQSHVPEVGACGYESFIGVASVALSPSGGDLFGLVDLESASGGGIYRATGPTAGVRLQAYTQPSNLLGDAAGNFFVSESVSGTIHRYVSAGGSSLWVSGFHTGDDDPFGMCVAPAGFNGPNVSPGDLLVTDRGFNGPDEVWAFSAAVPENERLVLADPGETDYLDMAAAAAGIVFMVDALDPARISRLLPDGTLSYLTLSSPVAGMTGIVWDSLDDRLYVVSNVDKSLHRINPNTGAVTLIATGFSGPAPCAIEINTGLRRLWVADKAGGRIYSFCLLDPSGVADGSGPGRSTPGRVLSAPRAIPNPSGGRAAIEFSLTTPATVDLAVFDINGRFVAKLEPGPLGAGAHRVEWDGHDDAGRQVVDGLYFLRAGTATEQATGRLVLIRGR